jgi:hypothetical protein
MRNSIFQASVASFIAALAFGCAGSDPNADRGGTNSINGSADGLEPFNTVSSALWISTPDAATAAGSPETTVVYLFSSPTPCDALTNAGWDTTLATGTQYLETKMRWRGSSPPAVFPESYAVVGTAAPDTTSAPPGGAFALWARAPMPANLSEVSANRGMVTLTALNQSANVTGQFSVSYNGGGLSGIFSAIYCPGGREP